MPRLRRTQNNMYKFPIRVPEGWQLTVTQPFRSTELADWYKARHINMPEHNGVDVVCGDGPHTYGTACVWPFPFPGKVYDSFADAPIGAKLHAHAQIDGVDPVTGILYSLIFLHLSAVSHSKLYGSKQEIIYNEGDVIGYIGNNGWVNPEPTQANPFGGSHLHLGLGIQKPGENNATMVDATLYLDINDPFHGPDDPGRDQPVYDWAQGDYKYTGDLSYGQKSDDISHLQARLGVHPATGYFGPITRAAVIAYQIANHLPGTGFVGPLTRAVLNGPSVPK